MMPVVEAPLVTRLLHPVFRCLVSDSKQKRCLEAVSKPIFFCYPERSEGSLLDGVG